VAGRADMDRGARSRGGCGIPRPPLADAARVALVTTSSFATSFRSRLPRRLSLFKVHFLDVGRVTPRRCGPRPLDRDRRRSPHPQGSRRRVVVLLAEPGRGAGGVVWRPTATRYLAGCPPWSRRSTRSSCSAGGAAGGALARVLAGVEASGARWHRRRGDRIEVDVVVPRSEPDRSGCGCRSM